MSGSYWKFRKFGMITLKVLNLDREIVNKMTEFIDFEESAEDNNQNPCEGKDGKAFYSDLDSLKSFIGDNDANENDRTFCQNSLHI